MTWKASATPAGRPLSRLVPSMRPTEEIGFGSSPIAAATPSSLWTTPTVEDASRTGSAENWRRYREESFWPGCRLRDETQSVQSALWSTPTAKCSEGSQTHRSGARSSELLLQGQAEATELGVMPYGSLERTAKPGGLNPAFVCWLMGYPVGWLFAAPPGNPQPRRKKKITGSAVLAP